MQAQGTASSTEFGDDIDVRQGRLTVRNESALRTAKMDSLVRQAVFGEGQAKDTAQWMIWETAQAVGVRPASIHDLYAARGRGEVKGFTVPAMNVRGMSYDTARAIFRTA
ncbi:MAG TPA: aldolase, partial [Gemmatimonadaceae bacterium]|nr:aldolase [Gemmatimonadaceae bacterium]